MTNEELDDELHTIVGAIMLNNMVASSEACGRIRDAFYRLSLEKNRLNNVFHNYFITIGNEAKFNELKGLIK